MRIIGYVIAHKGAVVWEFNKLKLKPTRCVLGGDSNLVIGLGKELSVLCTHPECARSWNPIAIADIHPVLGGDFLFQYICPRHGLINEG